ncbi:MAG: QueT transporter family protein [Oscillospiraceae bacterium]|nr:QueT transporter family protein [Oscillospiraceae bacterium]
MNKSKNISRQAMIAAMYTVIGLIFAPLSFGTVQVRFSETLTLLPVFASSNIWGVTLGCLITNIIGLMTGANILGSLDIIFGTAATFFAAVLTYLFRKIRIKNMPMLSALPPVIINAVVVGWELCIMINGSFNPVVFWAQAISVGLGQAVSCMVLGVLMVRIIEKHPALKEMMTK